jgi:hypothetical protein
MERMRYHFILFSAVCTNVLVMAQATHALHSTHCRLGTFGNIGFRLSPQFTL